MADISTIIDKNGVSGSIKDATARSSIEEINTTLETVVSVSTAGTAVGTSTKPVYINSSGVATASSSTVGSSTTPVYLNSGVLTACSTSTSSSSSNEGVYPFSDAVELDYTWAELDAMTENGEYEDIRVGDYKTITMNGNTIVMEIAGIDTYYKTYNNGVTHHIDWISRDCYPATVQWNTSSTNNGSSTSANPFVASNVYTYLNSTLYGYLPSDVSAVVKQKKAWAESRYSSGSSLTDSTSWSYYTLGYLWLPSEVEVYGMGVWSTAKYATAGPTQYPIFRDGWARRVKGNGNGGSPCHWWLRDAYSGTATYACFVNVTGTPGNGIVTGSHYVPVCFRIASAL